MSEVLLDKWAAAAHTGLSPAKLINQCRLGTGPTFIRPSPHAMMFRVADLDAWMATWTVHPRSRAIPCDRRRPERAGHSEIGFE